MGQTFPPYGTRIYLRPQGGQDARIRGVWRGQLTCLGEQIILLLMFRHLLLILQRPYRALIGWLIRDGSDYQIPALRQQVQVLQRQLGRRPHQRSALLVGEPDSPRNLLFENPVIQPQVLVLECEFPTEQPGHGGDHSQARPVRSSSDGVHHPQCLVAQGYTRRERIPRERLREHPGR